MSPEAILSAGRPCLDAVLAPAGFTFMVGEADQGSGGRFVQAAYVRGGRRLEFSVRQSLGLVVYSNGGCSLSHEDYVRAVTAGKQKGRYPGFSDAPTDAFADLAADLAQFGQAFLGSDPSPFAALCSWVAAHPQPSGLSAIG